MKPIGEAKVGNLKTHWVINQQECEWKGSEKKGLLKWEFKTVRKWKRERERESVCVYFRELWANKFSAESERA